MKNKKLFSLFAVFLTAFLSFFLLSGCEEIDDDSIEYVNEDCAYLDGDSCVERYCFYEEDGEYKRYIAGKFYGEQIPGIYQGTLFETGTYTVDDSTTPSAITLNPLKRYNLDTKNLENLGLTSRLPYGGTITDKTLKITYGIYEDYWYGTEKIGEVEQVYTRK